MPPYPVRSTNDSSTTPKPSARLLWVTRALGTRGARKAAPTTSAPSPAPAVAGVAVRRSLKARDWVPRRPAAGMTTSTTNSTIIGMTSCMFSSRSEWP